MAVGISTTMVSKQQENKFVNLDSHYSTSAGNMVDILKAYLKADRVAATPSDTIPVVSVSANQLLQEHDAVYRFGHSTMMIRLDNTLIMTDPVFSERASPVQWAGPKRFHSAPISIDELPNIDIVVISHDHYDHLDKSAVQALNSKVSQFITPLKVGQRLIKWGISPDKIQELDWWEGMTVGGIDVIATPSQHFSGRGLFDKDTTLWASWVIRSTTKNLFFSGDSGYFEGFKKIGERYGPFDLTMMETGAYNKLWKEVHMMPEESLQAHIDLKGTYLLPIHNGTFDLSLHDWYEPFERILALGDDHGVEVLTPIFGDEIALDDVQATSRWWKPQVVIEGSD